MKFKFKIWLTISFLYCLTVYVFPAELTSDAKIKSYLKEGIKQYKLRGCVATPILLFDFLSSVVSSEKN